MLRFEVVDTAYCGTSFVELNVIKQLNHSNNLALQRYLYTYIRTFARDRVYR